VGCLNFPIAKITCNTPYAIQNDPHIPGIAVATPSRAFVSPHTRQELRKGP